MNQKFPRNTGLKILATTIMLLLQHVGFGQFTYIGGGLSNKKTVIEKGNLGGANGTFVRSYNFDLDIIFRLKRDVGVGLEFSLPMTQTSKVKFDDGNRILNDAGDFEQRYRPSYFFHLLEESPTVTIFGRLFFADNPSFNLRGYEGFKVFHRREFTVK